MFLDNIVETQDLLKTRAERVKLTKHGMLAACQSRLLLHLLLHLLLLLLKLYTLLVRLQILLHFCVRVSISRVKTQTILQERLDHSCWSGPNSFSSVIRYVSPTGTYQLIGDLYHNQTATKSFMIYDLS